ncbi:MAG TPA: Gfo/Idh/MocA family oxidoreductase [Candidatus Brocadiia bacterium]|nr:Gfo/Idh/MocA family oxidoreductase [Candidatus Brocadiia bacterium]
MKRIKIGVIGVGGRGSGFAQSFMQYPDLCEVAGLYDTNLARVEAMAKINGFENVPRFDKWSQFTKAAKYDLVIVTTSDDAHPECVCKALKAGYHVFCDKPLSNTAQGLIDVMEAYDKADRMLLMGFNLRYHNMMRKMKEVAQRGELGDIKVGTCTHPETGIRYFRRWHKFRSRSGGLVIHKGCHQLDIMNWIIGSYPVEVYAQGDTAVFKGDRKVKGCHACPDVLTCPFGWGLSYKGAQRLEQAYARAKQPDGYACDYCPYADAEGLVPDFYLVTIRYANGARASYNEIHFSGWHEASFNFFGDKAGLTAGQPGDPTVKRVDLLTGEKATYTVDPGEGGHGGADPVMILDMIVSVMKQEPRLALPEAGCRSSAIGIAAMKSIDEGRPVRIEELVPLEYLSRKPDQPLVQHQIPEFLGRASLR